MERYKDETENNDEIVNEMGADNGDEENNETENAENNEHNEENYDPQPPPKPLYTKQMKEDKIIFSTSEGLLTIATVLMELMAMIKSAIIIY